MLATRYLLALVLVAATLPASAEDLAGIKARGRLRVIGQKDEAPEMFSYASTGEPGFEREMIEGFARLHGLKVEPVPVPTSGDRIPALTKGTGDVIIGIVDTAERRKLIDFTLEVIPARHLVISHKPHRVVATLEEFRAEKVGAVKGTTWAQTAIDAGISADAMELYPDRNVMIEALKDGKITASVMTVSDFTLAAKQYSGLQGGVFVGPATAAAWGVRKGDPKLRAALDEYLANFRKSPSWSRLVVKYFGDSALAVLGRTR